MLWLKISSRCEKDFVDFQKSLKGFGKDFNWFPIDFQFVSKGFGKELNWFSKDLVKN